MKPVQNSPTQKYQNLSNNNAFYGAPNAAHDIEESNVMEVLLTVMHCLADRKNTSKSIDEVNVNLLKKNDWSIELVAKLLKERDIE